VKAETFSLANVIRAQRLARPDAPALTFEGATRTFADLDAASSRVANALSGEGVGAGDRVAVLSKNCPEFFEIAFGCSKIGAILVGLNWRLAAPEIEAIVADATPTVIFASRAEGVLLGNTADGTRTVWLGDGFEQWRDAAPSVDPMHHGRPEDVCLILYTSGTTGLPKGVMLSNASMAHTPRLAAEAWQFHGDSVNLVAMPLFHIGGIGYGLSAMCTGGHTVLMRDVDTSLILATIEHHRVTHAFFVPAVIHALLQTPGVDQADLTSLELIVYGASPIGDAVLRRAIAVFGCGFTQAYGMTETSGTIVALPTTDHDPDGPRARLLRSCGRPLPWIEARLVDPSTMNDAATGSVGEIWLRGAPIMAGYWNKPDETAATVTGEGWLRTGDAAFSDDEGYLFLFDRFKDMIVSGAENVYPAEVENVLGDHPAVSEVAVIGVPHERWGETVKAIVVRHASTDVTEAELIEFARTRLAKYKCPTSVDFAETLPRNASGKLLKKDLRTAYWQDHDRAVN
jgi:long-chain acyl-CoA synthetase